MLAAIWAPVHPVAGILQSFGHWPEQPRDPAYKPLYSKGLAKLLVHQPPRAAAATNQAGLAGPFHLGQDLLNELGANAG